MVRKGWIYAFLAVLLVSISGLEAGVPGEIKDIYIQEYKNKAMFLKIPVRGFRQVVHIADSGPMLDPSNIQPIAFKVGDQVRILEVDFRGDVIRFKVASIDLSRESQIDFTFAVEPDDRFTQRPAFDAALAASFTEGISYTEVDSAKEEFIQGQFDQLISQFAATTGTSPDFVIKTISEKNPEYRAAKAEAAQARTRIQNLEQDLRRESQERKELESQASQVRRELAQSKSALENLTQERNRLTTNTETLRDQVRELQAANRQFEQKNREYERQVNDLVKNLDVKSASNMQLGEQVGTLTTERASLSQKIDQVNTQLSNLRTENQELSENLKSEQSKNSKLDADLRSLTSDKTSLNARFIETRRQKEILETAAALSAALHLEKRKEEREEGYFQVADLYLNAHKIATFEMPVPRYPEEIYPVKLTLHSPDTVQFTEEERALYQALGEKLQVETTWKSSGSLVKPVLVKGQPLQSIAPRDSARWSWLLQGEPAHSEDITFTAFITDHNGQKIALAPQEFTIYPAGITARLLQAFSPFSLLAGILIGALCLGLVFSLRSSRSKPAPRERRAREPEPKPQADFVAQKKL